MIAEDGLIRYVYLHEVVCSLCARPIGRVVSASELRPGPTLVPRCGVCGGSPILSGQVDRRFATPPEPLTMSGTSGTCVSYRHDACSGSFPASGGRGRPRRDELMLPCDCECHAAQHAASAA